MRTLLTLALCLAAPACVGQIAEPPDDGGGDAPVTGVISADATWSGTVRIGAAAAIAPGVTVTAMPGTRIQFQAGAGLTLQGTLKVAGSSAQKVTLEPASGATFGSLAIPSGGKLDLSYAVMTGGDIRTEPGSTVTIVDSKLLRASGDLLILNGGSLTMSHSQIGPDPGETDTTHCNIHTGGNANTISITYSNINGVPYGLMLYGGQSTIFTNNNWTANGIDVDTQPGVSGDFSGGWFDGPAPVAGAGATLIVNNVQATRRTDTGVRP
jgi:hypothetical protein